MDYKYETTRHNIYIQTKQSSFLWTTLSLREYLREKAAESRHDETSAYLMFIAGSVLFVGGILETLFIAEAVNWILFVPVGFSPTPGCMLGLALTLSGLVLITFGLAAGTYFARDRAWYMKELQNSEVVERNIIRKRRQIRATKPKTPN